MQENLKHFIVIDFIKERITSGCYKAGSKIDSETSLAKELNISRMTVRKAILSLVGENILYQKPRLGTFVSNNEDKLLISVGHKFGFVRNTRHVRSEVILLEEITTPAFLQVNSDWDINLKVYHYKRRRFWGDVVYAFEEGFIPIHVLKLTNEIIENSVLDALAVNGYTTVKMEREFHALLPNQEVKNYCNISNHTVLLKVSFFRYNSRGELFAFNETYYNQQQCKFIETTGVDD